MIYKVHKLIGIYMSLEDPRLFLAHQSTHFLKEATIKTPWAHSNKENGLNRHLGETLTDANCGVFIINLDRREDRWVQISKHLKELNCHNFLRIAAVDGLNEPKELARKVLPIDNENPHYLPTKRQMCVLGCLKSHLKALKLASQFFGKIDKALILEDDCFFIDSASSVLEQSLGELPSQWQCLMLGAIYGSAPGFVCKKKCIVRVYNASTTHAYMVNRDSCQLLIRRIELMLKSKTLYPIDELFVKFQPTENWYATNPLIAGQCSNNYSDINGLVKVHTDECFKLGIKINRKIWIWLKVRPFLPIDLIKSMINRISFTLERGFISNSIRKV